MIIIRLKSYLKSLWLIRKYKNISARKSTFTIGRPTVIGFMSAPTGLGHGARLIYAALKEQGCDPDYIDITKLFYSEKFTMDHKDVSNGPLIFHVNAPELLHVFEQLGQKNLRQQKIIAVWAWEQTTLPQSWRRIEKFIDEIWATSHFLENIFKKNLMTPVCYTPYPITSILSLPKIDAEHKSRTFKVLTAFDPRSGIERKNPEASIEVFLRCFSSNPMAELTIKVPDPNWSIPKKWQELKNVKVNNNILSDEEMQIELEAYDCVMSLHRSEGFGFLIASALAAGIPTIFTEGFGCEDFSKSPGAYKVSGKAFKIQNNNRQYNIKYGSWVDPNLETAQSHLNEIYNLTPAQRAKIAKGSFRWWKAHYNSTRFYEGISTSTRLLFIRSQQSY